MQKRKPPKLPESTRYQDQADNKSPDDFNRSVMADKLSSIKATGQTQMMGISNLPHQARQPSYNRPGMQEFFKPEASR